MLQFLLILLGLISNPYNNTTTHQNCNGNGNDPTIVNPQPDTGGDNGHIPIPPKK